MAGAGYKLFNTGDVLTAAQVNTYLMEQSVMVFADAAARTTALTGVVAEGMLSYLKDTNAVEVYNGSAWVASDDPNAIQNTIVDAKGDLIAASAADTPARLAVGTNNQVLIADSAQALGIKWGAVPISAYAAWTPTFDNLTVGNGTLTAQYVQIGKMVHWYLKLIFGSTTSITGAVRVTGLPIAPVSTDAAVAAIVQTNYADASGDKFWGSSHANNNNTTRIWLSPMTISGSYIRSNADLSSTVPFTWTTTDILYVSAVYEGA